MIGNIVLLVYLLCVGGRTDSMDFKKHNFSLDKIIIKKGTGHFSYDQYLPLADKPLEVFYYSPRSKMTNLRIVIVLPGLNRNAEEYRDAWIELAIQYDLLIISPQFSKENYPDSRSYNLGNMFDEKENPIAAEEWSFSIIDPLFDFVKNKIKNKYSKYFLFGHSAGSQFVSRLMIFKPNNKVEIAIVANAGWYTHLNNEIKFPYGLAESPLHTLPISIFGKKIIILLGEEDCQSDSPNLRRCPEADAQGNNRFARGFYFFNQSKLIAEELNIPFNWEVKTVPNVGHDGALIAKTAAKLFFDDSLFSSENK